MILSYRQTKLGSQDGYYMASKRNLIQVLLEENINSQWFYILVWTFSLQNIAGLQDPKYCAQPYF